MSARGDLADVIRDNTHDILGPLTPEERADAILAAGYSKPRTITTVEELDALPNRAVVLDAKGDVWRQDIHSIHWWDMLTDEESVTDISRAIALPATVLHEPQP